MLVKFTDVGTPKQAKNGKMVRDVMAEGWPGPKGAWDKTCAAMDSFRAGDSAEVELDPSGKYINSVRPQGAPAPTSQGFPGGKGYASKSFTPDPEKNAAVYTSYALDLLKADKAKTPAEAVDMVFATRALVKGKL